MAIDARALYRAVAAAAIMSAASLIATANAQPLHACDALGERGWRTEATMETVAQTNSAPRSDDATGEWFVERATTQLPLCNYYNSVGNYSLRSYSLSPETRTERITICRRNTQGVSVAVAPYAGPCPPT